MSWVLPNVISTEDIVELPTEVLAEFTKISTGIVTSYVNKFVEANINSSNPTDREAAVKLKEAYAKLNKTTEYLKSKDAQDFAESLSKLQYSDVSYNADLEVLKMWRLQIIDLLSEDENFRESYTGDMSESETRGMKTAYTPKLDKDNLEDTLARMTGFGIATGTVSQTSKLIARIKNNPNLFKNGNYNLNNPTVMRKAIYKRDKLINILKGLDFIIPRKEAGTPANTWRRF